jgi:RecA-family ATPase
MNSSVDPPKHVGPITTLRQRLRTAGYSPIPVNGKAPPLENWETKFEASPDEIMLWPKLFPYARSTGALCRFMPTLDIDIMHPEATDAVEALARERFEERGYFLVRFGRRPKRAVPLRTDQPFKKIARILIAPDGTEQKIEILGDGQQVVVAGIHKDTAQPYEWFGGEPGTIPHEELPYITEAEARQFVEDAARLLIEKHGFTGPAPRPKDKADGTSEGAADWAWLIANIHQGHQLHDSIRDLAAKLIGSGMSDGAAVNFLRAAMGNSTAERDNRFEERIAEIPRAVSSAREKWNRDPPAETNSDTPAVPLPFINMSSWDNEPIPEYEWSVPDRYPLRQTVLSTGEGAVGKSLVKLHLCVAHVLARDWLGTMPEPGPTMFVDAEDDEKVLHIRLAAILKHYGATFADAIKGGLHLVSLLGRDAVLGAPSRSGKIEPTALYKQLLEAAGDIKPKMIGIASSADVFAGNENDRPQVRQFVNLLTKLAIVANGTVSLIAHPSLTGINTGTGLSGNTAWHNSVRARDYMTSVKPEAGEQPESDLREIIFKKNQYGPIADRIVVRYQNGLFLPVPGMSSLDQAAREARADDSFLTLLRQLNEQGQDVSPTSGTNFAPAVFARHSNAGGLQSKDFRAAMQRLLDAKKIRIETFGPPSKNKKRLILGGGPQPSTEPPEINDF